MRFQCVNEPLPQCLHISTSHCIKTDMGMGVRKAERIQCPVSVTHRNKGPGAAGSERNGVVRPLHRGGWGYSWPSSMQGDPISQRKGQDKVPQTWAWEAVPRSCLARPSRCQAHCDMKGYSGNMATLPTPRTLDRPKWKGRSAWFS